MTPGLRFLFKKRAERLMAGENVPMEVVTANPESVPKDYYKGTVPPHNGHVDQLEKILKNACPDLTLAKIPTGKYGLGNVVCYDGFNDSIQHEM